MSYTPQPQHVLDSISYLLDQELTTHRFLSMELFLIKEYWLRNRNGCLAMSFSELEVKTNSSTRTVRSFVLALRKSGRWEINTGDGRTRTTYTPLFLNHIAQTEKKGN